MAEPADARRRTYSLSTQVQHRRWRKVSTAFGSSAILREGDTDAVTAIERDLLHSEVMADLLAVDKLPANCNDAKRHWSTDLPGRGRHATEAAYSLIRAGAGAV